ncbi:acyl carrier protein [Streptomyces sp. NPDC046821]|uniref:acyl carrier protein n=1 Tax=Streptomyces sp. NPDC046821 TaxID=3154702 RepID=UPI0034088518
MIATEVTFDELALLMKKAAGITVKPEVLKQDPDSAFANLGIDSLGLLGIVGEIENQYSRSLPPDSERCKTPREFLDVVNNTLKAGA